MPHLRGRYSADYVDALELYAGGDAVIGRPGKTYRVDARVGLDTNNGKSWNSPLKTMEAALALVKSGDAIRFRGKVREQLVSPVGVFDVTIVGEGNRPRHADVALAGDGLGGHSAANTWTTPAVGATTAALLKVLHQGWRFVNILFAPPTDHAGLWLYRGGAPDTAAERDASHAEILGCRFAGGQDGIYGSEPYNVRISQCVFHDQTGYAIKPGGGGGIAAPLRWQIVDNEFDACANWMGAWAASRCRIERNRITNITTLRLDTRTGAGHNLVVGNYFDIAAADMDASGNVFGHATDVWSNTLLDTIETGVPA